jgi:hypothetical protein
LLISQFFRLIANLHLLTIFTRMSSPQRAPSRIANTSSNKLCGKPAGLVKRLALPGVAGAALGLAASPAQALTEFSGLYAPANWTQIIE